MFLRTATVAMLIATPGLAADPVGGPASADWAGGYAGLTLGGIRSTGRATRGDFSGDLIPLDVSNGLFPAEIDDAQIDAIGGFTLGYDRQRGSLVAGVEVDVSFANSDVEIGFSRIDPNPNPPFAGQDTITGYDTELDGLATARLRVGYAAGRTLLYGTAGLAVGRVENRFSLALPGLGYSSPDWSESGTLTGYTIGAGAERQVTGRLTVKLELLHYDLEDVTVHAEDQANFPGNMIDYEFDNSGTIGRIGLNYRF